MLPLQLFWTPVSAHHCSEALLSISEALCENEYAHDSFTSESIFHSCPHHSPLILLPLNNPIAYRPPISLISSLCLHNNLIQSTL